MQEHDGNETGKSGTVTASLPQWPAALELALMPEWRRATKLRHMGALAPSTAEIEAAWLAMHNHVPGQKVYFIRRGLISDGPIKIGMARNPAKRMAALQTACAERLVMLATVPGGRSLEQEYHRQFAQWRMEGEWFKPGPAIVQEIDRIWTHKPGRKSAAVSDQVFSTPLAGRLA